MTNQYPSMPPDAGGYPAAGPAGPPPPPVENAVRLMFLNVIIGIIGIILVVATKNSLRDTIANKNPGYDTSKLDSAVNAGIVTGVVIGIIVIVLYVLLALQVRKGKNWARIVTWVLAALGVLSALSSLAQTTTGLNRTVSLIQGLVDLAIIILLALGASNAYFRKRA